MYKHNLIIIYRSLKRFKSTFYINLIGLSTGLACALIIYLWVNDELSFDKFHTKDNRLFQVMERQEFADGIAIEDMTSGLVAETLVEQMPEVEYATAVTSIPFTLTTDKGIKVKAPGQFVSNEFFNIFSFDLLQGDKNEVLKDKNSVAISEELALRLFNTTQHIIGKTLEWEWDRKIKVTVSGVFKGVPHNSSEKFDFVFSFEKFKEIAPWVKDWGNDGTKAYLTLKKGTNAEEFNQKISGLLKSKTGATNRSVFIRPYSEGYLYGKYENGAQAGGRIEYVKLFSIVGLFILVIACINFMNLSTARASRRMKEVGIKKVVGARKVTLISQFLVESMMMAFLSLAIALVLVFLILPYTNQVTGKQLSLHFDTHLILTLITITLFTGILSGSYPAFYLSRFKPVSVLKGSLTNSLADILVRKGLVIIQFTISIILIVAVFVVYKQLEYVQTKNLGYNRDNILYFETEDNVRKNQEAFLSEVKKIPGVKNASSIWGVLPDCDVCSTGDIFWEGRTPEQSIAFEMLKVNYGMIEMLDMKMKEGRTFSKNFSKDDSGIIFNEAAIEVMGLKNPVGKIVQQGDKKMEILAVAKDFHFQSLHEKVKPLFITLQPAETDIIMVKITAGKEKETITQLQKLHQKFNPGHPFDFKFLDEEYQSQYVAEQRVSVLSRYFAALAIIISCLGLFGLVAFTAERRLKEIGIRKVLGLSEFGIMRLLSNDFTKMVLLAILIALPLSYFIAKHWLNGFAYRIDLEWWSFVGAGLSALIIAWATVGMQALKVAKANPIKSLKIE